MQLTKRQIINRIYQDICGFEIPKTDEQVVRKSKGNPLYGEITIGSVNKLLDHLNLSREDFFYDLGSGVGKVVMHTALFTPVKKAIGIELSQVRHSDSLIALDRATTFDAQLKKRCEFRNADLLETDLSRASVIYTCSTAFSNEFMRKLTAYLSSFTHNFTLVTLKDLASEKNFEMIDTLRLDMSWQRATPVYLYRRR